MPVKYRKGVNLVLMWDNGPRHTMRLGYGRYWFLIIFFCSLPVVCVALMWLSWRLWQETRILQANIQSFEADCQLAQATAERLGNLEALLQAEGMRGREVLLRSLANSGHTSSASAAEGNGDGVAVALQDGPGHEDFPVVDIGELGVSNVQVRLRGNRLRIALDLANAGSQTIVSGEVEATLVLADGTRLKLVFSPEDVGCFRISRFKHSVMAAKVPSRLNLENAQVIIEVKNQAANLLYRNIFAVQR